MSSELAITGSAVIDFGEAFRAEQFVEPNRLRRMDPLSAAAVAAARLATRDAGLELERSEPASAIGVAFGTAYGCQVTELRYAERLVERGAYFTNPIDFPDSIDGAPAAHVAMELGLGGPSVTHADGHLAGELALLHAVLALHNGRAPGMVVGAGDYSSPLLERLVAGCAVDLVAVPRGGGAVAAVFVEPVALAHARGARVLALIAGMAFGGERATRFGRAGGGRAAATAIDQALAQAHLDRGDVAEVNPEPHRAGGLASLVRDALTRLARGDVRVIVHHATAPGGQSVALALKSP